MPTYACSTAVGRLTQDQRLEITKAITAVHAEETGAPRYLVQVIFYGVQPGSHYVGGEAAPSGQIWIRGDIRSGRTDAVKRKMIERLLRDVGRIAGAPGEDIWVYLNDIPAANIAEYGRVLPPPGEEEAWLATVPNDLRNRLRSLG